MCFLLCKTFNPLYAKKPNKQTHTLHTQNRFTLGGETNRTRRTSCTRKKIRQRANMNYTFYALKTNRVLACKLRGENVKRSD